MFFYGRSYLFWSLTVPHVGILSIKVQFFNYQISNFYKAVNFWPAKPGLNLAKVPDSQKSLKADSDPALLVKMNWQNCCQLFKIARKMFVWCSLAKSVFGIYLNFYKSLKIF
jgi:hypothetical protein